MSKWANAVFKGGGVKGVALTGALCAAEEQGWRWKAVAGTSAGAITAALVAAGYTADEVHQIINDLDFEKFKDGRFPVIELLHKEGMYKGQYVIDLMNRLLTAKLGKSVVTFADLPIPLKVVATDVTFKRMITFPDDLGRAPYGFPDPSSFPVAWAVRASMSIPLFFEPYQMTMPAGSKVASATLVDGGMLSNFPIHLFNPGSEPARYPTFGYYLQTPDDTEAEPTGTLKEFLHGLVNTVLEGHDNTDLNGQNYERTIYIPTGTYKTTDFHIQQAGKDWLYQSGLDAAKRFLEDPGTVRWLRLFPGE